MKTLLIILSIYFVGAVISTIIIAVVNAFVKDEEYRIPPGLAALSWFMLAIMAIFGFLYFTIRGLGKLYEMIFRKLKPAQDEQ